jgi:predicted ATPase
MISKINIQNYKCWVEKDFYFHPLTILAGGNAVGKSSVVQSMLLIKKAYENVDKGEILATDIHGINLGLPKDIISKDKTSEEIMFTITYSDHQHQEVKLAIGDEITSPLSLIIHNMQADTINSDLYKHVQYLNAERIGPRIAYDLSSNALLDVGTKGEFASHVIHQADLLKREIPQSMRSSELARFSANCESWLNIIIPGTQFKITPYEEVNKVMIKYKNTSTSSDEYIPTATGFGITYVLPIIVAGLILSSVENSLLIVENPEAHLHPYGQSNIGKFLALLAACGVQVVVETHSEHVINGARLQLATMGQTDQMAVNFFSFASNQLDVEQIGLNTHGELESWPKGFFDQSKTDLRELLGLRLGR